MQISSVSVLQLCHLSVVPAYSHFDLQRDIKLIERLRFHAAADETGRLAYSVLRHKEEKLVVDLQYRLEPFARRQPLQNARHRKL